MSIEQVSVYQQLQYGLEASRGAGATINSQLISMSVEANPDLTTRKFRANGNRLASIIGKGKDFTSFKVNSEAPIFEEMSVVLASVLGKGTAAGQATTYSMSTAAPSDPQTYSFQIGGTSACTQFDYAVFTGMTLNLNPSEVKLEGEGIGGIMTTSTWATGAAAPTTQHPIDPGQIKVQWGGVYVDFFKVDLQMSNLIGGVWALNGSQGQFTDIVDLAPDTTITVLLEADSSGLGLLDSLRGDNDTVELIVEMPDASGWKLELYAKCKIEGCEGFSDHEGVYAVQYKLSPVMASGYSVKAILTAPAS